jgi:hypothetical protein
MPDTNIVQSFPYCFVSFQSRSVLHSRKKLRKIYYRIKNCNGHTVLRRIFGTKANEVAGGWRKLHNDELRDLYSSPSINRMMKSRRMKWAGQVARMGKNSNMYRLLVGKPEGRRPLRMPRRRWVEI